MTRSPISMTMFHGGHSSTDLKQSMANFRSGQWNISTRNPKMSLNWTSSQTVYLFLLHNKRSEATKVAGNRKT